MFWTTFAATVWGDLNAYLPLCRFSTLETRRDDWKGAVMEPSGFGGCRSPSGGGLKNGRADYSRPCPYQREGASARRQSYFYESPTDVWESGSE
jgi:hypothetical protein